MLSTAPHVLSQGLNGCLLVRPNPVHGFNMGLDVPPDYVLVFSYESLRGRRAGVLEDKAHLGDIGNNGEPPSLREETGGWIDHSGASLPRQSRIQASRPAADLDN